jgi:transcription initiation factor IIF auxiliary subunit
MSIGEALKIEQSQNYQGDDWWSWSVWLSGSEDELDKVAKVEYTLHRSFSKPVRTVENREDRFKLSSEGWGGFLIYATVFNKDGGERHLEHQLRLYYP